VTNIFAVPTLVKLLVDDPGANEFDHGSLKQVIYAGAPMYREDQKAALRKLGKVLIQYYGLAEVSGNISVLPADEHFIEDDRMKLGSCGFSRTGMHVDIQDETGQSLGANKTGEICVTGLGVFAGYHNNDVANAKAFRNGWFRTGDLGYLDGDGYLYITGRATDMIISGGMNIYPREVEERFLEHADIGEVAVVGLPDSKWGETCAAVVVPTAGAKLNAEGLAIWASKNLAVHQRPKHYYFWDVLPKSDYGKIDKLKVKRMLCDYSEA
jgi:fatty-acyl-CoA synthase